MSDEPAFPSAAGEPADPLDPVESLLASCLERGGESSTASLDEFCREHPEHADELRSRFALLVEAGLADLGSGPPEVLERLGGFRLLRRIGGGGMGVVYLARDERLGREVALKVIRPGHEGLGSSRERFRREIATVALLEHPGIVPVYSVGEDHGVPFFAMERVQGATLAELLSDQRGKPVESLAGLDLLAALRRRCPGEVGSTAEPELFQRPWVGACLGIIAQVADALQHAHERGVLHRDVKPSNVMLTPDGRARLLDFGLASREGSQKLTGAGAPLGSLPYMAPEQVRSEPMDARSDVYSLGATLYELLTLEEAFLADTPEGTRRKILAGRPLPVSALNPRVPWDVETVCATALDPEPRRRYASAAAFRADLHNLLSHRPIHARRPGPVLRARRFGQRHPTASVAAGLGLLLVLGLPTGLYLQERRARQAIDAEAETARRATDFLVDLFEAAGPRTTLGKQAPVSLLLDEGMRRIHDELKDQPRVRVRLLGTFGAIHHWLGAYPEAEALLREQIELLGVRHGPAHPETCAAEVLLADALIHLGRHREALARLDARLEQVARAGEPLGHARADLVMQRGLVLEDLGREREAEQALRQSLEVHRGLPAPTSCGSVTTGALGSILTRTGRADEGLALLREAVATWRMTRPLGHPSLVQALISLARAERDLGEYGAALDTVDEGLDELERIDGQALPIAASVHGVRADILTAAGDRTEAGRAYCEALRIHELALGSASPTLARSRLEHGRFLLESGLYQAALDELDRAVATLEEAELEGLPLLSRARVARAEALAGLGRMDAAAEDARRAVEESTALPQDLARAWLMRAWVQALAGDLNGAEESAEAAGRALETQEAPLLTATLHNRRAFIRLLRRDGAAAEAAARDGLRTLAPVPGGPFVDEARAWNFLGWARDLQGDAEGASEALERSVALFDRLYPEGHPEIPYVLELLGVIRARRGPAQALPQLERALELRRRFLPAGTALLTRSVHNLGAARALAGQDESAAPLLEEAIELLSAPGVAASPELATDLQLAAAIRLRAADPEGAVLLARRALATTDALPGGPQGLRPEAELVLGRALAHTGAIDDGLEVLEGLCLPARAAGLQDRTFCAALEELAALYARQGRTQAAADCRARARARCGGGE